MISADSLNKKRDFDFDEESFFSSGVFADRARAAKMEIIKNTILRVSGAAIISGTLVTFCALGFVYLRPSLLETRWFLIGGIAVAGAFPSLLGGMVIYDAIEKNWDPNHRHLYRDPAQDEIKKYRKGIN